MTTAEVSGFEVLRPIGFGTTAVVHLARHRRARGPGRLVALKVFRPGGAELARRERAALAQLARAPGVIRLQGWCSDGGGAEVLVLEHVAAGSLSGLVGGRRVAPARVERLAGALLAAVGAVHGAGLVHGDVKPANVLVDHRGGLRLADFGCGGPVGGGGRAPVAGTVAHLAPEVLAGGPPTPAADLYAVGSTLRELLAGPPRADPCTDDPHRTAQRALDAGRADLDLGGASGTLRELLDDLLSPDPSRRGRRSRCPGAVGASR